MITKEEVLRYISEESHPDEVIKYLSSINLESKDLKDVISEIPEPSKDVSDLIPRNTYEYQVLQKIYQTRLSLACTKAIETPWEDFLQICKETGHNLNKLK